MPIIFKALFRFFTVDDLAAFVGTGLHIYSMRTLGLARVFIDVELWQFQCIVGTALARAGV